MAQEQFELSCLGVLRVAKWSSFVHFSVCALQALQEKQQKVWEPEKSGKKAEMKTQVKKATLHNGKTTERKDTNSTLHLLNI